MSRISNLFHLIQDPRAAMRLARLGMLAVGLLALALGAGAPECPGGDGGC